MPKPAEDFQEGNLSLDKSVELLHKIKKDAAIKKELKKLNQRLNQAAFKAGFKKPE